MGRDVAEHGSGYGVQLAIGAEEADHPLALLERLNHPVQHDAIKAAIAKTNAMLVVLAERVHGDLQDETSERIPKERLREQPLMQDYHQLDIWQRAMTYVVHVYEFSAQLPQDERYNLTAQLRKAATSVPLNIAEGAGCTTNGEFARFLSYAYRSLKEVVTCLELCQRLYGSLAPHSVTMLIDEGHQISRMTHSLMRRLGAPLEVPQPSDS